MSPVALRGRPQGLHRTPDVVTGEHVGDVAAALDLLALSLGTGVAPVVALEAVAAVSGPVVSSHLSQVAAALRWGLDTAEAWQVVPPVWGPARQAMALAERTGAAPGALLISAAAALREDAAHRAEIAAAKLGVWLVVPLGLCFLPAFFLIAVVPAVISLGRQLMPAV